MDSSTWKMVMNYIRTYEMPPKKAAHHPNNQERDVLGGWIEDTMFNFDPNRPDPGRVTIRRLNRTESNNTVRDLVGIDFRAADDFPAHNSGYGSDNIAKVLSMPPVLPEDYQAAAKPTIDKTISSRVPERQTRRCQTELMERGFGVFSVKV